MSAHDLLHFVIHALGWLSLLGFGVMAAVFALYAIEERSQR